MEKIRKHKSENRRQSTNKIYRFWLTQQFKQDDFICFEFVGKTNINHHRFMKKENFEQIKQIYGHWVFVYF